MEIEIPEIPEYVDTNTDNIILTRPSIIALLVICSVVLTTIVKFGFVLCR